MEDEIEQRSCESLEKNSNDETPNEKQQIEGQMNHNQHSDKENSDPNREDSKLSNIQQQRRHDEPSELSFEICK
jgi:hypothetical protein